MLHQPIFSSVHSDQCGAQDSTGSGQVWLRWSRGGPHPAQAATQLTHSLETGREIWEERERERDYAVACKLGDVRDGRQDKTIGSLTTGSGSSLT